MNRIIIGFVLIALGLATPVVAASATPDDKVVICHVPPGNPANAHTIEVSENALDAHLAHGDTLGACPVTETPTEEPSEEPTETPEPTPWPDNGGLGEIPVEEIPDPIIIEAPQYGDRAPASSDALPETGA